MQTATIVAVLCTLACFHGAQAGFWFGPCPSKTQPMAKFNLYPYAGRWYQTGSFGAFHQWNGKCSQAKYTPNIQGGVHVVNTMLDKSSLTRKEIYGSAFLDDPKAKEGRLTVTLEVEEGRNQTAPLWVLGTDYDNYAVAYTCANYFFSLFHYDMGWIASRQPEMSQENINKVNEILASNGLSPNQFTPEVQDCGPLLPPI